MSRSSANYYYRKITENEQEPVVLISLADYNYYQETLYLLKSPKNAQRLRDSIA
ncbi:MAG: type II toxin-antitoxin system Phd/YefM family antitoxin, partial [Crocosphaera sp.]